MSLSLFRICLLLTFFCVLLLGLGSALGSWTPDDNGADAGNEAQAEAPARVADEQASEESTVTFEGMQIAIDPETGRLRAPTDEEARELASRMRQRFARTAVSRSFSAARSDAPGMMRTVVGEEHLNFSVVSLHADGSLESECIQGHEHTKHTTTSGREPATH